MILVSDDPFFLYETNNYCVDVMFDSVQYIFYSSIKTDNHIKSSNELYFIENIKIILYIYSYNMHVELYVLINNT